MGLLGISFVRATNVALLLAFQLGVARIGPGSLPGPFLVKRVDYRHARRNLLRIVTGLAFGGFGDNHGRVPCLDTQASP